MGAPKYRWLNRGVALPGPFLTLCLTEEDLSHAAETCRAPGTVRFPLAGASTTTFQNSESGELCSLIAVSGAAQKEEPLAIAGLLVHEAVHVWQDHAQDLGEDAPGKEQEAYAIQSIAQELMTEFARRLVIQLH